MKKKKSSPISFIIVVFLLGATLITEAGEEPGIMLAALVVVLVITFAVLAAQKAKQAKAEKRPEDPRMKSFTRPDAPCIVCEHTGEDHLQRDKINRIRQLDDWLKSGLIDRKEYVVLKDRYERDM